MAPQITSGQEPVWKWAKTSSTDTTYVHGVAVDNSGNSVAVGTFSSKAPKFGNITLTNSGEVDAFLVKYDSLGNVLWAKSGTGIRSDELSDVDIDNSGNIYVCGSSESDLLKFGNVSLQKSSQVFRQIFIVKFDQNGNALWGKNVTSTGADDAEEIEVDNQGNVYYGGPLTSTLNFGTGATVTKVGNNFFLAKYNTSGTFQWVRASSGPGNDALSDIATDPAGNIYITGSFNSGQFKLGSTTLNPIDEDDSFLARYSSSGAVTWNKLIGSTGWEQSRGVVADGNGNVWVAGTFGGFGDLLIFADDTIRVAGPSVMFVARYDNSGTAIWGASPGPSTIQGGDRIATDGFGYVWVAGTFRALSDTLRFGNSRLTSTEQGLQTFVAKYDPDGEALWGVQAKVTGDATNYVHGLGVDNKGFATVGGYFTNATTRFGTTTLTTTLGKTKMFVARVGADQFSGVDDLNGRTISVTLFPNPSTGWIRFVTDEPILLVEIYSLSGQRLLHTTQNEINLNELSSGTYLWKVFTSDNMQTGRLTKQ